MMQLINFRKLEYNENHLSENFLFDNNDAPWTSDVPGAVVEFSTDYRYVNNKSLRVFHTSYNVDDITFKPTTASQYTFTVPKTGRYTFSYEVVSKNSGGWFPEVEGICRLILNGNPLTTIDLDFKIGNNTEPEFTFNYRKWQTFYETFQVTGGTTIDVEFFIPAQPSFTGGFFELFFEAFKFEFVTDRVTEHPTYYTKPVVSKAFKSITAAEPITLENEMIEITAGTFTLTLPTAVGNIGKEYKFMNSGSGIINLDADGGELINGQATLIVPAESGYRIVSNGTSWRIIDRFRFEILNRTQWVTNIALTNIPNATSFNLLTLIPNASKLANGTDGGINELNIDGGNKIFTVWKGSIMYHTIRITGTLVTGTDQHYTMNLRRFSDNSILGAFQIDRNADTGIFTALFTTYTYSDTDPFVTGGFYISFDNNSGAAADITTSLNLLITTIFK